VAMENPIRIRLGEFAKEHLEDLEKQDAHEEYKLRLLLMGIVND